MPKIFKSSGQYGIKRTGKFGRLSSAERAEMNIQRGLYDESKKVTAQMQKDLDNLFKEIRNQVNSQLAQLREYEKETGRKSPSLMTDIYTNPKTNEQKMLEILRGKEFLQEETSTIEGTKDFFDELEKDDIEIPDEVAKQEDRWTIFRRLADLYPNYSQSELLDMIDEYMAENAFSVDQITEMMLAKLESQKEDLNDFEENAKNFRM